MTLPPETTLALRLVPTIECWCRVDCPQPAWPPQDIYIATIITIGILYGLVILAHGYFQLVVMCRDLFYVPGNPPPFCCAVSVGGLSGCLIK